MKKLSTFLLLAACGGGSDSPDAGGGPDATIDGALPLVGAFRVSLVGEITNGSTTTPGYSSLLGKVYDGVMPEAIIWQPGTSVGGCTLLTPKVPFCATPCGGSAVCVADNTCKPYATAQPLGTVTATGLLTQSGEASFTMEPIANAYQPPANVKLAYPAYREGEKFEVVTSGSAFAPSLTIGTRGITQLKITSTTFDLMQNTALPVAWTPPTAMGSKIHIKLDISHHGGSKGKLDCVLPDSGSVSIDAGLITQLLNLGAAGYPTIIVTRSHTGSAAVAAGRIALVASSTVEKPVNVPGITSCTDTSECPMGQTCQTDLSCR